MNKNAIPAGDITVRRAVREDCPQMMELIRELAAFEREPEAVTVSPEHFCESGFGGDPVWWAFVAAVPGSGGTERIVGFALYYVRYSTWKGRRMYLEDIIVTEAYRRKGIGGMLMDAIIGDARNKGFHGITWQVLHWNEAAIKFYGRYNPRFDHEWVNVMIDL